MKYIFDTFPDFNKSFKKLLKKYKSLKSDLENLREEIQENPDIGVSLGEGLRKIRLNITSKNKGKSGGARVITYEVVVQIEKEDTTRIYFVDIYDKSEYEAVNLSVLKEIIKEFREEINE
ncbi:toxin [Capnocytophaga cynodegmi]|uniref:toxin n=1 Tax=Capnocytophaga cynodegmi TaxID=28189 RepID=UPI001AC15E4C|nr:toxin [Capnocytophaga cynodegmi]GIM51208.1 hypothetical protein CAPN004_02380 [Capnocytophaga cynodegmi]